jgi:thiamine-monophosphate kinase
MRETDLIRMIRGFAQQLPGRTGLIQGVGDDCAVLRPRPNEDLVFTTDFVIEDRHFTTDTHTAGDVGHKALARSLSDLAAMGAEPVFCLVSLAFPQKLTQPWLRGFYKSLMDLAGRYKIALAGGDLARSERITVDVMCCGRTARGRAMLRSTARPGDSICVTGELGGAAAGLVSKHGPNWLRQKRPQPRIEAGLKLRTIATAGMDLSDGLSLDLYRLCEESKCGATLDGRLPIAKGASLEQALHGGEDYELLFTVAPQVRIPKKIAGLPLTRIGAITNTPRKITLAGEPLRPLGFDHFR